MKVSDVEFTRTIVHAQVTADEVEQVPISFAFGLEERPILTRIQAGQYGASNFAAAANEQRAYLENGIQISTIVPLTVLTDPRALPIFWSGHVFVTTGGAAAMQPVETRWWKILMPQIQLHFEGDSTGNVFKVVMHYRIATLTPDEIVALANVQGQI